MKLIPFVMSLMLLTACATEVELQFEVLVQNVDTVEAQGGTQIECDVVVIATAIGDNGQIASFGEADFTFRSLATGATFRTESVSSAFMSSQFNAQGVEAGTSLDSRVIQRPADEGFDWDFVFFYRQSGGARASVSSTAPCG